MVFFAISCSILVSDKIIVFVFALLCSTKMNCGCLNFLSWAKKYNFAQPITKHPVPLFYQQYINETTSLAVWQITETEDFFLAAVPLSREITHPHKRLQHLAGRYLLQHLFPAFPIHLIQIASTRKPYLEGDSHHFSISHCGDFVAAIVSTTNRVGIDIEMPVEKIGRIVHKFLKPSEQQLLENLPLPNVLQSLTIAWSAKEAMFKWYGLGKVDFKEHMHLDHIIYGDQSGTIEAAFLKDESIPLQLSYHFFDGLVLSWLHTGG